MSYPDPPVLLMQSGQFTCPRCGGTNAVAQLISAGALANPLAGFCNRCEHPYQLTVGAPSTTTSGTSNDAGRDRADGGQRHGVQHRGRVRRGRQQQRRRRRGGADGLLGWLVYQHPHREHAAAADARGRGVGADRHARPAGADDLTAGVGQLHSRGGSAAAGWLHARSPWGSRGRSGVQGGRAVHGGLRLGRVR